MDRHQAREFFFSDCDPKFLNPTLGRWLALSRPATCRNPWARQCPSATREADAQREQEPWRSLYLNLARQEATPDWNLAVYKLDPSPRVGRDAEIRAAFVTRRDVELRVFNHDSGLCRLASREVEVVNGVKPARFPALKTESYSGYSKTKNRIDHPP